MGVRVYRCDQYDDGRWWVEVLARDGTAIVGEGVDAREALYAAQANRDGFEREVLARG